MGQCIINFEQLSITWSIPMKPKQQSAEKQDHTTHLKHWYNICDPDAGWIQAYCNIGQLHSFFNIVRTDATRDSSVGRNEDGKTEGN